MTNRDTTTVVEEEACELENTAHWRSQKAEEYPDDARNAEAAKLATALATQLRDSVPLKAVEFSACVADALDLHSRNGHEVIRRWVEYRSRLGFDRFPETANEYLNDLIDIARDVAAGNR